MSEANNKTNLLTYCCGRPGTASRSCQGALGISRSCNCDDTSIRTRTSPSVPVWVYVRKHGIQCSGEWAAQGTHGFKRRPSLCGLDSWTLQHMPDSLASRYDNIHLSMRFIQHSRMTAAHKKQGPYRSCTGALDLFEILFSLLDPVVLLEVVVPGAGAGLWE